MVRSSRAVCFGPRDPFLLAGTRLEYFCQIVHLPDRYLRKVMMRLQPTQKFRDVLTIAAIAALFAMWNAELSAVGAQDVGGKAADAAPTEDKPQQTTSPDVEKPTDAPK